MADRAHVPHVLVVEDDPANRALLSELLIEAGCEPRAVGRADHGLDLVAGWPPDLLVLDLSLPDMEGWEFLRRARETAGLHEVPVIVVSALAHPEVPPGLVGQFAVVQKPFDIDAFLGTVRSLLVQRCGGRARSAAAPAARELA
jgi:CheY-like chemotaxis protein